MLGQYNLLPLLKGWDYKLYEGIQTNVVRGAAPINALSIRDTGWLVQLFILTTDAYGQVEVTYQGAELKTQTIGLYPEYFSDIGAFSQDPAGWMQRYSRPNPASTQGIYAGAITPGWQGGALPFVPTITLSLQLLSSSTQATAYIAGIAWAIIIIKKETFIKSLRRILDPASDLSIDPGLLATGPSLLRELGEPMVGGSEE